MLRVSTKMMSDQSVAAMLKQQARLNETQLQLSSGKRVLTPADDPASAVRILDLNAAIGRINQYQDNANRASQRLALEEDALSGGINLLQRAKELAIQGNNDMLTASDRGAIAAEVRQLLDEMVGLANSTDSNGEYLFAGYQSNTQPFSRPSLASFSYNGDMGQRQLQISTDRQIAEGNNGFETFMNVPTGPFVSLTSVAATGFGNAINDGEVLVNGVNIGPIPAATSATERAQQLVNAINQVADISNVSAVLAGGDTITLSSSAGDIVLATGTTPPTTDPDTGLVGGTYPATGIRRDIFSTLEQFATALEADQSVDRYINDLQLAMEHLSDIRSTVGARQNAIDEQTLVNEGFLATLESQRSEEQDLDYAEAISRFNNQLLALQAAQQTYSKLPGLSRFNFL